MLQTRQKSLFVVQLPSKVAVSRPALPRVSDTCIFSYFGAKVTIETVVCDVQPAAPMLVATRTTPPEAAQLVSVYKTGATRSTANGAHTLLP